MAAAAAEEGPGASFTAQEDALLRVLAARGWRFRDPIDEAVQALFCSSPSPSPEAVESEIVDMDLWKVGGKSLPDRATTAATAKRLSYLHGPIVLQVVSVSDIYRSSIDASFKNLQQRRLLRFVLAITEEIAPGTKIRLENKIPINNGILCLSAINVSVIGGTVQSLYEEWQINQKFSGLSRPSLRLSQSHDGSGPPPFEKLDIESCSHRMTKTQPYPADYKGRSHDHVPVNSGGKPMNESSSNANKEAASTKVESKQSISGSRPKVSDAVPVQNQVAAQKLLQKMAQGVPEERHGRGQRFKSKGRQQDTQVFTLDEWEKRKAMSSKSSAESYMQDASRDEELARQLQEQLDLEDIQGGPEFFNGGAESADAERLRMNIFSFSGPEEMGVGRRDFRGRGRGRGRGGGPGRGRGRF